MICVYTSYCVQHLINYNSCNMFVEKRYSKMFTYGIHFGYVGSYYHGYQHQGNISFPTVEGHLRTVFHQTMTPAGRTDKGVSALGQIISFKSTTPFSSDQLLETINNSPGVKAGKIKCYGCGRVPKKFNPRSQAIWRKYLYLFPLNLSPVGTASGTAFDIDVKFIEKVFSR